MAFNGIIVTDWQNCWTKTASNFATPECFPLRKVFSFNMKHVSRPLPLFVVSPEIIFLSWSLALNHSHATLFTINSVHFPFSLYAL